MDKINWKEKFSSRKFWAFIAGFISALLFAFNVADTEITKVMGIVAAAANVVVYILGESYVDANRGNGEIYILDDYKMIEGKEE